jgi:hypothetical protein
MALLQIAAAEAAPIREEIATDASADDETTEAAVE